MPVDAISPSVAKASQLIRCPVGAAFDAFVLL
jgi:hypothetical protein